MWPELDRMAAEAQQQLRMYEPGMRRWRRKVVVRCVGLAAWQVSLGIAVAYANGWLVAASLGMSLLQVIAFVGEVRYYWRYRRMVRGAKYQLALVAWAKRDREGALP